MGFINISKHPVKTWSREQVMAASEIGGAIIDYPFPNVSPFDDEAAITKLAGRVVDDVVKGEHKHAMVMGEYALTIAIVNLLMDHGVTCYVAALDYGFGKEHRGQQTMEVRPFIRFREINKIL